MKISDLLPWSEPQNVETSRGPKVLRKAEPTQDFWALWKANKETLKSKGVSVSCYQGGWQVCWWADQDLKAQPSSFVGTIPAPEGLEYLPYQLEGIRVAATRGTLIADEMGLGKTVQAIGVANVREPNRVLIVCPASLKVNWLREWAKWRVKETKTQVINSRSDRIVGDVVIINYDLLPYVDLSRDWDMVILDEAHYIKNRDALRTQVVMGRRETKDKPALPGIKAGHWVILTGTPIVNRPIELWNILNLIDQDGLGRNWLKYAQRYCGAHRDRYGWNVSGATNLQELQSRLKSSCMVRRLKDEVLKELPDKRHQMIPMVLESKLIQQEIDLNDQIEDARSNAPDKLGYLLGEISRVRSELAVEKIPLILQYLEDCLQNEQPIVVFAHHRAVIDAICEKFPDHARVDGSTQDRQAEVDKFQSGQVPLFVGQIRAAGVGLTLVRSSWVIFTEQDWTPAAMDQAADRCHRIGQKDSVLVQHMIVEGSLDSMMMKRVKLKRSVIRQALDEEVTAPVVDPDPVVELKEPEVQLATPVAIDKEAILVGVKMLAGVCDGARRQDDMGFNGSDTGFGRSLAMRDFLTDKQALAAKRMLLKYKRQLPEDIYERIKK